MRSFLALSILLVPIFAGAGEAKTLDVYEVDRSWRADARVYYDCDNARAIKVRVVSRSYRADLRIYVVDRAWKADVIACK